MAFSKFSKRLTNCIFFIFFASTIISCTNAFLLGTSPVNSFNFTKTSSNSFTPGFRIILIKSLFKRSLLLEVAGSFFFIVFFTGSVSIASGGLCASILVSTAKFPGTGEPGIAAATGGVGDEGDRGGVVGDFGGGGATFFAFG